MRRPWRARNAEAEEEGAPVVDWWEREGFFFFEKCVAVWGQEDQVVKIKSMKIKWQTIFVKKK